MEDQSDLVSGGKDTEEVNYESSQDQESRSREFESYLKSCGFGFFHVLLLIAVTLANAADAVEVFGVSFVLPIAKQDLDISTAEKGWLIASVFIGMLLGGYVWGSFADACGRRNTLLVSVLWNGIFGLLSAFSVNFGFFLFCRLFSGIGIGGTIPVLFSYLSEFFTEKQKKPFVIYLTGTWLFGIIFTALLAWALMGTESTHYTISFYIGNLHFVHWRLFLIICSLPAFVFSVSILFFPESPAYLFSVGKREQWIQVLRQIQRVNSICPCCMVKQESDSIPLMIMSNSKPTSKTPPDSSVRERKELSHCPIYAYNKLKQVFHATVSIFRLRYLRTTVILMITWFTQCFGYYGLVLWFPEFFKRLQMNCVQNYTANTLNCTGNDTNLQFYQDSFYTALASLPGNLAGIVLISILGGRIQLVVTLLLSAMSVFIIWGVPNNHTAVVAVSCLFSAISINVFGAQNLVNMSAYDIEVRSTAFGVHSAVGRVGAILGNVVFGHLLDVDRGIPILIVASLLTSGALFAVFLPSIYRAENKPPLERLLYRFGKKWKALVSGHRNKT